jgi:type IV secretory pathway VirB4 component
MSQTTFAPDSTQRFVDIDEIKDGVVILKSGGVRAVVMVSGINFELKSEEEQDMIISAYQNFLNALDFSVQIIVHSRKLNIDRYLKKMHDIYEQEPNELLKNQLSEYISFIQGFVKENEIMTKQFFVVVPYEGGGFQDVKKGFGDVFSFFSRKKKNAAQEKQETIDQKKSQLRQRVDEVINGIERVGLRAISLQDEELLELFYNLYNPETIEKKLPGTQGK